MKSSKTTHGNYSRPPVLSRVKSHLNHTTKVRDEYITRGDQKHAASMELFSSTLLTALLQDHPLIVKYLTTKEQTSGADNS